MEEKFINFVLEHENDDAAELALRTGGDMSLAVSTVSGRRKIRTKVPSWHAIPALVYPTKLSVEQCSSEKSSAIRSELITSFLPHPRIADLTGGLGVDSWAFSKFSEAVLYVEQDKPLADAARENFSALGCGKITVLNASVSPENIDRILQDFAPDLIYLDPARRGDAGGKMFRIEDCRPNVLELQSKLMEHARFLMVKLSPMADLDAVARQLRPKRLDVISIDGECKELVATIDREHDGDCLIVADCGRANSFGFYRREESEALPAMLAKGTDLLGKILLEPDKALMKAGAFKLLSSKFGLIKLDPSTHYYIDTNPEIRAEDPLFRMFRILRAGPLNKNTIKTVGKDFPRAEVTARNIPLSSGELRKRLRVAGSDTCHIFGLRAAGQNLLIAAERYSPFK